MSNCILEVKGLGKRFRGFELKNVSFDLEAGYILGLIGPNGAGKTTLMKLIQNVVIPSSGTVLVNGFDSRRDEVCAKNEIGFLMEQTFLERYSLEENAKLFGRFYESFHMETFLEYLERFELNKDQEYGKLSKGMQTKFQLSFALSHEARLLILDEPTGGLDPIFRREFLTLLQEVAEQENVGIIISTHITSDLDKIADYIAFLNEGELVFCKSKEELLDEYWMIKGERKLLKVIPNSCFVAVRSHNEGFEALTCQKSICERYCEVGSQVLFERASIEDIMYYISKGRKKIV